MSRRPTSLLSVGRLPTWFSPRISSNTYEIRRSAIRCWGGVREVLKHGGKFIIMGPNIRYTYREYWDFYDHYLPLSHLSLAEGLRIAGFRIKENIPRFLPYTMNNNAPTQDLLVRAYLALPIA